MYSLYVTRLIRRPCHGQKTTVRPETGYKPGTSQNLTSLDHSMGLYWHILICSCFMGLLEIISG